MDKKPTGRPPGRPANRSTSPYASQPRGPRPTAKEREGVIYEPSHKIPQEKKPTGKRPPPAQKKTHKSRRSNFAIFYIITLFICVVVCIVIFALVFNSMNTKQPESAALPSSSPKPTDVALKEINQISGMIKEVSSSTRLIKIYDFESGTNISVEADNSSVLKDKYGGSLIFAELKPGQIIDVSYDAKTSAVTNLSLSVQTWELKSVRDLTVDADNRTITKGIDLYTYDDQTMVLYNGEPYDLYKLRATDVVTMVGIRDKLWYLEVIKGHGYIQIENISTIKDGMVEINTDIFTELGTDPVEVTEGTHRVVVRGSNIEPFTQEVVVRPNETETVSLKDIEYKSGMLTVKVNEDDYRLLIDGESFPTDQPAELVFGEYTVRVEKEDFVTAEQKVTVNQPEMTVSFELKKELKLGEIRIETDPEGASVYVDNAFIGTSPCSANLEYGSHYIIMKKEGYHDADMNITIEQPYEPYLFKLHRSDE